MFVSTIEITGDAQKRLEHDEDSYLRDAILMSGVITVLGWESEVIHNDQQADNAARVMDNDDANGPSGTDRRHL